MKGKTYTLPFQESSDKLDKILNRLYHHLTDHPTTAYGQIKEYEFDAK